MTGTHVEIQAADVLPPMLGDILALDVTTSSQVFDLETIGNEANLANHHTDEFGNKYEFFYRDRYVTLLAEGCDVWFGFSSANDDSIDETTQVDDLAHADIRECPWFLPENSEKPYRLPDTSKCRYLYYKGSTDGTLRIAVSSRSMRTRLCSDVKQTPIVAVRVGCRDLGRQQN